MPIEWTRGAVVAAGTELRLMRAGKGTPVVVLHRDIGTLEHLAFYDALAEQHDVLIPIHPGYSDGPRPDWIRSLRDIAALYRIMLDGLGVRNAALVGLGFGGWIAAEMASMAPSDVSRLVLAGPMGVKPPDGDILDQALISYIEYARAGFHDPTAFERNYGAVLSTAQLVHWDLCREMSFRVAWKPYMYSDSLPHLLAGVRAPALVIHGDHDQIVPASASALYAERLPNATLQTIAAAGHLIEMEQPKALASVITSFLASA